MNFPPNYSSYGVIANYSSYGVFFPRIANYSSYGVFFPRIANYSSYGVFSLGLLTIVPMVFFP